MSTTKRKAVKARRRAAAPRRAEILNYLARRNRPVADHSLFQEFALRKGPQREELQARLDRMQQDGQIIVDRRGRVALPERMDMVRGRISGHPDGYGFLSPEQGGGDLYLPAKEMRKVLHGDRAVAKIVRTDRRGRREGAIVEILEHVNETVVGRYIEENEVAYVLPEDSRINQDILVPRQARGGAQAGQIVIAAITRQPGRRARPQGRVVEILGEHMAPGMEIEIAIRKHGLPHEWPVDIERELGRIPGAPGARDRRRREDLRDLPLLTIDGEDARDFDDAVYCEKVQRDWRLVVAIADVSHYVKPDTALDQEARRRGNSVYFPQRVIPMLPEKLSNGLCSLNPEVDRLCFVCDLTISGRGRIKSYRFYEAVMRSRARLTYTEVAQEIDQQGGSTAAALELAPQLRDLQRLAEILRRARFRRGSLDLDLPETRIVFNQQRKIERIEPVQRNDAHRLIEECMLAANICAADMMSTAKVPGVYRQHEDPDAAKVEDVRRFLGEFGLSLPGGDQPQAQDYATVVAACASQPHARVVQTALLRSLSQAHYTAHNGGHFALGFEQYAHFTSPIRRYPDLLVHRTIKRVLQGDRVEYDEIDQLNQQQIADHCSMTERRADDATRDVEKWLKVEYMLDRVGEVYPGVVSAVTEFGLFVELDELYVEGLVHVTALGDDYFHHDPVKRRLTGARTGISFRPGDRLEVKVVRVDLDEAKIDFEPLAPAVASHRRRRRRSR